MTTPVGSSTQTNTASSAAAASGTASTSGIGGLTMSDFLTLMTAQLQNQDPLNPTDSNQFLSQLSQLSTVEGITQLNTSMNTLSNSVLSSQALTASSLVGTNVLAPANATTYTSGTTLAGAVQVPAGATAVNLNITNSGGAVVGQIAIPATAGVQNFSWNGTSSEGAALPSGAYSISATATVSGQAAPQTATVYLNGTVSSVTLGTSGDTPTLNTSQLGPVALSAVQQID
jgi:flagellar basal-body rod modification protein FlgD